MSGRDHLTLFYNGTTRLFLGRGIGPTRAPETGQNQPGSGAVWKIQEDHLFSPRLHASLLIARVSNTFSFVPIGGADVDAYRSSDLVWHRSYMVSDFDRPQSIQQADASAFLQTPRVGHELRFGVGHRSAPIRFGTRWPGSGNWPRFTVGDSGAGVARLTREANAALETTYSHVYVAETASFGDWTMQGGLRLDIQRGMNWSSRARANPVVPDLLPEAQYEGDPRTLSWQTIVPRLGLTRAWRRTLVHAGYAVYTDLLGNTENATANPLAAPQFIDFLWEDANADRTIQRSEIQFDRGIIGYQNLDPSAPSSLASPTRLDYGMRPATMREVLAGVQHELRPRLTLAVTATWRVRRNIVWTMFEKTRGAGDYYSSSDYTRFDPNTGRPLLATGTLPDGSPYSAPYYRLAPGVPLPVFRVVTNRPDYEQSYRGVQLFATRRFFDRWMFQGAVSWSDWRQHIGAQGVIDPSMLLDRANGCSSCNDAPVVVGGTMLKENVYMNARWSGAVNALYEFPWKVTVAANIFARQGYVIPYYHHLEGTGDRTGAKDVLTVPIDRYRLDTVHNVDLRIAKRFDWANGVGCAIALEVLNATNAQTVLQRQPNLYSSLTLRNPAANQILETQSPRIARLSVRFFF